jgi:hypothetical protein
MTFSQQSIGVRVMPVHEWEVRGVVRFFSALPDMPCSAAIGLYPLGGPYPSHAPFAVEGPSVGGIHHPGRSLALSAGYWRTGTFTPREDGDRSYAYRWELAESSTGLNAEPIAGETSTGYDPAPGDIGKWLRAVVRCTDTRGAPPQPVWREAATPWVRVGNEAPYFSAARPPDTGLVLGWYPLAGIEEPELPRLFMACGQIGCVMSLAVVDPDGIDPLTVEVLRHPSHGTIHQAENSWEYVPTPGYSGPDSALFQVSDGLGGFGFVIVALSVSNQ